MTTGTEVAVAKAADIPNGEARAFNVGHARVLVANVGGSFHAIDDTCTHDNGPLGEGTLDGCAVTCPRHGARFDVRTGAALSMPAAVGVRTYPVRVSNGEVVVQIDEDV